MEGYSVKIVDTSISQMSGREKIKYSSLTDTISIKDVVKENGSFIITPVDYVALEVHNENSKNKDYEVYLIIDKSGDIYSTSSRSLYSTFHDIFSDMLGEDEEYQIKIFSKASKNNENPFLTCSIL